MYKKNPEPKFVVCVKNEGYLASLERRSQLPLSSLLSPLHGVVGRQQALGLGACPACRTPIGASAAGRPSAGTGERRRRVRVRCLKYTTLTCNHRPRNGQDFLIQAADFTPTMHQQAARRVWVFGQESAQSSRIAIAGIVTAFDLDCQQMAPVFEDEVHSNARLCAPEVETPRRGHQAGQHTQVMINQGFKERPEFT